MAAAFLTSSFVILTPSYIHPDIGAKHAVLLTQSFLKTLYTFSISSTKLHRDAITACYTVDCS